MAAGPEAGRRDDGRASTVLSANLEPTFICTFQMSGKIIDFRRRLPAGAPFQATFDPNPPYNGLPNLKNAGFGP